MCQNKAVLVWVSLKYILQLIDQNVLRKDLPTVLGVIIVKPKTSRDPLNEDLDPLLIVYIIYSSLKNSLELLVCKENGF